MTSGRRSRRRLRSLAWWRDRALTVGAVVGTICIVVTVVGVLLDVRVLVFRSGSMSPEIRTGALAFAQETPADELVVGDVVSVLAADGTRVTHRIEAVTLAGGAAQLTLRGDANAGPDSETYTVASADRVVADVPWVGYAVGYASGPVGIVAGSLLVGGLLWLVVRPSGRSGGIGGSGGGGRRRAGAAGVAAAIVVAGTVAPAPTSTMAYFSDAGTVQSSSLTAHTLVSQAQPACANVDGFLGLGDIARLTWTQVDARYEYHWELRRTTVPVTVAASGNVGAGQAQGTVVTLDSSSGLLSANGNFNLVVRARLPGTPTWVAATETTTPVRRESFLLGLRVRCGHAA